MATASEAIEDALGFILVRSAEAPLSADDEATGRRVLNDMLMEWAGRGLRLGFNKIDNIADDLTVPDASLLAIKQNLGVLLAPQYGRQPDPLLISNASKSLKQMMVRVVNLAPSPLPETLPVGSGNDIGWGFNNADDFYGGAARAQIRMTDGTTATVINAVDTPVLLVGAWTNDRITGFDATTAGRLTRKGGSGYVDVNLSLTLTAALTSIIKVYFAKNGVVIESSGRVSEVTSTSGHLDLRWTLQMLQDDYVEVYVANTSGTANITASAAVLIAE